MTMNLRYTVNSSGREKGSAFGCKIRGTGLLAAWAFSFHGQIEKLESDACLHQNGTQMILNCIWRTKRHRFLQCERPSIAGVTRTLTANKLRGRKFRDTKHIWSLRRKDEYVKQCTEYYSPLGLLKLKVYCLSHLLSRTEEVFSRIWIIPDVHWILRTQAKASRHTYFLQTKCHPVRVHQRQPEQQCNRDRSAS